VVEELLDIQRLAPVAGSAVGMPGDQLAVGQLEDTILGRVRVQLDIIGLRIVQVGSFCHHVIGRVIGIAQRKQPRDRTCQLAPVREQDRVMVDAGNPLVAARPWDLRQPQQVLSPGAQSGRVALLPVQLQAQHVLVKGKLSLEVCHRQMDVTDASVRVNAGGGRGAHARTQPVNKGIAQARANKCTCIIRTGKYVFIDPPCGFRSVAW
jgi:hypothetical protein